MLRRRRDRGEVSVQVVLLTPVVLLLVMVVVQAALWYHAAQLADNAAADGAAAAARYGAGAAAGSDALAGFVSDAGGRLLVANVSVDGNTIVAVATVHVPHVVPGWPDTVTRRATAPIERITMVAG
jgi:Flp pilus assembly protein TadG